MSSVDNRTVAMRFDNQQFERGVQESVRSIDNLKKGLDFGSAVKGVGNLAKAVGSFTFDDMKAGIDAITHRFSAMGIAGETVIRNITNSAYNMGKQLLSSFTVDPVKTGFQEYETQIGAVQTILANTQEEMKNLGLDEQGSLDKVNASLDELNLYADKTIYNFTEMTRNIGTFTAAGVKLDDSVNAIKGIANLAAVSGSTSQQASTAMYQLSQALSTGALKLQDWNSVVNAGMGGQVFQNALKRTAKNMNITVDKTVTTFNSAGKQVKTTVKKNVDELIEDAGSFRESLTDGWITADVLTETLSQLSMDFDAIAKANNITVEAAKELKKTELISKGYTKSEAEDIIALAETASDAATKVKTFTQLMDTLKESAQSGWTQTWEMIVGDFGEAKNLWTTLSDYFGNIINGSAEARNSLIKDWIDLGGRQDLLDSFWNIVHAVENIGKVIKDTFNSLFGGMFDFSTDTIEVNGKLVKSISSGGSKLKTISERIEIFTKKIKDFTTNSEKMDKVRRIFKGLGAAIDIVGSVVSWAWQGFTKLIKAISPSSDSILEFVASIGDFIVKIRDSIKSSDAFKNILEKIGPIVESLKKFFVDTGTAIGKAFGGIWAKIKESGVLTVLNEKFNSFLESIPDAIAKLQAWGTSIIDYVKNSETLKNAWTDIKDFFEPVIAKITEYAGQFAKAIKAFFSGGDEKEETPITEKIKAIGADSANTGFSNNWFDTIKNSMSESWNKVKEFIYNLFVTDIPNVFSWVNEQLETLDVEMISRTIKNIASAFLQLSSIKSVLEIGSAFKNIGNGVKLLGEGLKVFEDGSKGVGNIGDAFKAITKDGIKITKITKNKDSVADAALKIAAALGILVAAIVVLSRMDEKDIKSGLETLGILAAGLLAVALIFKAIGTDGKSFIQVAAAVAIMAIPVYILGNMDTGKAIQGVLALGFILLELAAFTHLVGKGAQAKGIISLSIGLLALTGVIAILGNMDLESLIQGMAALAVLFLELGAFMRLAGKGAQVKGVLGLAIGLLALTGVIAILANMDIESLVKGLAALGVLFLELGIFMKMAGNGEQVKGVLGMAIGLLALTGVIAILANMNFLSLAKGLGALGILFLELGIFTKKTANSKQTKGMITMAIALNIMALAVKQLGEIKLGSLIKGVGAISLLLLVFGKFSGSGNDANLGKSLIMVATLAATLWLFIEAFKQIEGMDTDGMLEFSVSISAVLSALALAMNVMGKISIGQALTGAANIGIAIAAIAAILLALGALQQQWEGMSGFLEAGGNVMQLIGEAIGKFVGGIAGGFVKGMDLPGLGTELSGFMTNAKPFLDNASSIGDDAVTGIENLCAVLLAITGTSIVTAIGDFLTAFSGESTVENFGTNIKNLAIALKNYATEIDGFTEEADQTDLDASVSVAKSLSEVNRGLPRTGGNLQKWLGEQSLSTFADNLVLLAGGLMAYASGVSGFADTENTDNLTKSVEVAKGLAEVNRGLPRTGGNLQKWLGEQSLSSFAINIGLLAGGLMAYAVGVSGFADTENTDNLTKSVEVAKGLAEVNRGLPRTGGNLQKWIGEASLGSFAGNIGLLAFGLRSYAVGVKNFTSTASTTDLDKSVEVAKGLAGVNRELPFSGGAWQAIAGTQDLGTFGTNVGYIGEGLGKFVAGIAGISTETSADAISVLGSLDEFTKALAPSGGALDNINDFFAGDSYSTLMKYVDALAMIGTSFSTFGTGTDSIKAADPNFESAKTLLQGIIDFADYLEVNSINTGLISTLGYDISSFGTSFTEFATAIAGVTIPDNMDDAMTIIGKFKDIVIALKDVSKDGWFDLSDYIKFVGEDLEGFFNRNFNTDTAKAEALGTFVKNVAESAVMAADLNDTSLQTLQDLLNSFSKLTIPEFNDQGYNMALEYFGGLVKGLEESIVGLVEAANELTNAGLNATEDDYKNWYDAGRYLALGLANGITSRAQFIHDAAVETAKTALEGITVTWNVNSPSKKAEELGMYFDYGLANGLSNYSKVVTQSATDVGQTTVDSAKSMLANLSFDIANGIDAEPVIRPVIDMTDVSNGMNTINGMFNANHSINTGLFTGNTFKRSASELAFDGDKIIGTVSNKDVVSAINDLTDRFNDLSEAVSSINIVLDSGTLVGQLDTKIDRNLGVLAARRGRGN